MAIEKTLEELSRLVGGRVEGDGSTGITGVNTIDEAGPGEITFLASAKYARRAAGTRASALIVAKEKADFKGVNLLVVKNPHVAFAEMIALFCPSEAPPAGVHARAFVHPDAVVGEGVYVGPFAFIDEGASLGANAQIHPGVFIGRGVEVGSDSVIYSNVSIRERSVIGRRVIIHCNSVIGSDGFGFAKVDTKYRKVPQAGTVTIGDDVEIGASVTIDRATVGVTSIGRGTKIDNLVQIAHNVIIGEDTVIVSQVGISGSTRVGSRVTLAGQVGVAGHIEIADDCTIGAKSGVSNTIKDKGIFTGYPPMPHGEWLRAKALFARLPELKKRIEELEERLKELES